MTLICHTCRDNRRVTEHPRTYGEPAVVRTCPDCAPPRETPAQADAQRIAETRRIEDEIERHRIPLGNVVGGIALVVLLIAPLTL